MFDLSWSHILIVLIVALVVIGPKDLPRTARIVGRWVGKARAMAAEFRKSFDEMARQSELDELRSELAALREQRPFSPTHRTAHEPIVPGDMMSAEPHEPELEVPEPEAPEPEAPAPATDPAQPAP
jgi:sec-independent protein translocase protein TatB